jgi:hypothetical protein
MNNFKLFFYIIKVMNIPQRYIPNTLSKKDKKKQRTMINKSRKMYKQQQYYTRKPVASYKHKTSRHITNAKRIYGVEKVAPTRELAMKTGCSIDALQQIVKKGQGAYYSSGSRPNQTSQSWGLARLASSITAGKAAKVDYDILEKGCNSTSKALKLAKTI